MSIDERPVLVLFDGWTSLFRDRVVPWRIGIAEKTRHAIRDRHVAALHRDPALVCGQRARRSSARASRDHVLWQEGKLTWLVALLELEAGGERSGYFMPLALAWEERDEERVRNLATAAVAKIRQQANVGVMGDAFADEMFCRAVVAAMATRKEIAMSQGKLQFRPTAAFGRLAGPDFRLAAGGAAAWLQFQYRRVHRRAFDAQGLSPLAQRRKSGTRDGLVPDRSRAATRTVRRWPGCSNTCPTTARRASLAMLQGYVANQGDGWTYSLEYLQRHLEQYRTTPAGDRVPANAHEAYLTLMRVLARAHRGTALRAWRGRRGIPPSRRSR